MGVGEEELPTGVVVAGVVAAGTVVPVGVVLGSDVLLETLVGVPSSAISIPSLITASKHYYVLTLKPWSLQEPL